MSRGAGNLQRLILEQLDLSGPIQLNELCWQLATREGRLTTGDESGAIDRSFYSSFLRAVNLLGQRVVRSPRKLLDLNELVAYYPFKTRSAFIKDLRQRLLPIVADWLSQRNAARFRKAQTEHHLLNRLATSAREEANEVWASIESQLFDAISRLRGESRIVLLSILVKGRELFVEHSSVWEGRSLGRLIDLGFRLEPLGPEDRCVLTDVKKLYDCCLPSAKVNHAWLKSQLYSIVSFSRWGSSSGLSDEVKGVLLERDCKFIETLPGHVPPHLKRVGNFASPRKIEYSGFLNELIRRDVLAPFEFLNLASKS